MNNEVLKRLSYGVYVVSSVDGERAVGCVANSAMQVTHNVVAVSINHENYTNKSIKECKKFAISILSTEVGDNIIPVFGFSSSKDVNKFENVESKIVDGLNVLVDSVGYIVCEVVNMVETETHTIFLGKIIDGDVLKNEIPMTYAFYHMVKKGKSPKKAPTYIEESTPKECLSSEPCYKCSVCGYIYKGDITKEPDNYLCPICKQPKSKFEKIC